MTSITLDLAMTVLLAVMGSWQFGYNTGVINAPKDVLEKFISDIYQTRYSQQISNDKKSLIFSVIVSIFAFAGIFGGLSGGKIANSLGRKKSLLMNNFIISIGLVITGLSKIMASYEALIIGRFIVGYSCGLFTVLVPMYLAEISESSQRGSVGTLNQLGVTVGLLSAQILGLDNVLGSSDHWPHLFYIALIPVFIQMFLVFLPESPRFLLDNNQPIKAKESLLSLRGSKKSEQVDKEFDAIKKELSEDSASEKMSFKQLIGDESLRPALMLGIVMQLSQQLSGINAVFNYSTSIFNSAGIVGQSAKMATTGVGVIMVVMTLISAPLMESLGRRVLHLSGLAGMFFSAIIMTICLQYSHTSNESIKYLSVATVLAYVMFFAIGPGSIPWILISEIFTQNARGAAMSIAVLVNWAANWLVGITFPFSLIYLNDYSFVPFIILLAIFFVYIYKRMPETKGRSFEEISAILKPSDSSTTYGSAEQQMV